jgi:hypothetical protein
MGHKRPTVCLAVVALLTLVSEIHGGAIHGSGPLDDSVTVKLSTTPLTGPDQVSFSIEVCVFTVLFVGILVVGKRKPHIHQ